jgi:hypothetical protein
MLTASIGDVYLASRVPLDDGGSIHRLTYRVLVDPRVGRKFNGLELPPVVKSIGTALVSPTFNVTGFDCSCQAMVKLIGPLA